MYFVVIHKMSSSHDRKPLFNGAVLNVCQIVLGFYFDDDRVLDFTRGIAGCDEI